MLGCRAAVSSRSDELRQQLHFATVLAAKAV
jgi:hypothetical protein